jgi:hypothetical protein
MFIITPQPFLAAAVTFPAKTSVVHMGFDDPPRLAETSKNEIEALKHYRCILLFFQRMIFSKMRDRPFLRKFCFMPAAL